MKNAVVIVTYNRVKLLRECLECVMKQTLPFSCVIVVDNCSTDGTKEFLEAYTGRPAGGGDDVCVSAQGRHDANACAPAKDRHDAGGDLPQMFVLRQERNLGGAGGFYEGLKKAGELAPDWVLIMDDDAMIAPDYMERLADYAARHPEADALAGAVTVDGTLDLSHRRRIASRVLFAERFVPAQEYEREAFFCDAATFCGLAVRGSAVERIGLPKREYFLWYDDTEYCLRLQGSGGITVVPGAVLNHKTVLSKEGMVVKGVLNRITWRQYYGYRNRYDTARTHLGRMSAWCILWQYRVFWLLSLLMTLRPSGREQGRYNLRLLRDVLRDCKNRTLGVCEDYHR